MSWARTASSYILAALPTEFGGRGGTRTRDLQLMRLTSYQLLNPDIVAELLPARLGLVAVSSDAITLHRSNAAAINFIAE